MSDILVQEFYTEQVHNEWRRLVKDAYHRLEFETTLHFLHKYLPPHGLVLDAGCGPGRYSFELARQGYQVSLFDTAAANLAFAKRMFKRHHLLPQVHQVNCGSIVDLSIFPDATFDAVLCTGGPLSHVLDAADRARTISELVRVAKPGAPLFVSVIGRLSVLVVILMIGPHELELPHYAPLRDTGDYFGGHGFTACHFFLADELRHAFTLPEVEILEMAGLEGLSTHQARELNRLAKNEPRFRVWFETHLQTCTHPAVVDTSEHILVVGRKRS